jgi:hypothetical protein
MSRAVEYLTVYPRDVDSTVRKFTSEEEELGLGIKKGNCGRIQGTSGGDQSFIVDEEHSARNRLAFH